MLYRAPKAAPLFLRALLGVTFVYAGLQKFMTPGFFDPRSPSSITAQITGAATTSPIHALVAPLVPYAVQLGYAIALGEIAVGAAALVGLFMRPAAVGGAALSVSFWLTVNAHIHPYFFIPDIPWAALWIVLWMLGPGEYLSFDSCYGPGYNEGPTYQSWTPQRPPQGFWPGQAPPGPMPRRDLLGYVAAAVGLVAAGLIAMKFTHRGLFAASSSGAQLPAAQFSPGTVGQASAGPAPSSSPSQSAQAAQPSGQHIGTVAQLKVGSTLRFTHKGNAAVVVHPSQTSYIGLSLICTHAGCTCNLPSGGRIVCSCHGSVFSASNGSVLQGPASTPLDRITITVANGNLYAS